MCSWNHIQAGITLSKDGETHSVAKWQTIDPSVSELQELFLAYLPYRHGKIRKNGWFDWLTPLSCGRIPHQEQMIVELNWLMEHDFEGCSLFYQEAQHRLGDWAIGIGQIQFDLSLIRRKVTVRTSESHWTVLDGDMEAQQPIQIARFRQLKQGEWTDWHSRERFLLQLD